jgi:hypothetical protein
MVVCVKVKVDAETFLLPRYTQKKEGLRASNLPFLQGYDVEHIF